MGLRANIPKGQSRRAIKRAAAMQAKIDAKQRRDLSEDQREKLRGIFIKGYKP